MKHDVEISMINNIQLQRMDNQVVVDIPAGLVRGRLIFKQVTDGLFDALQRIKDGPVSIPFLMGKVMKSDGFRSIGKLNHYLQKLSGHAILEYHLILDDVRFASISPLTHYFCYDNNKVKSGQLLQMSKFAYCYKQGNNWLLRSPLSYAQITLHHPTTLIALHHLAQPKTPEQLAKKVAEFDDKSATAFINFLANANAVQQCDEQGITEESGPVLGPWAFHDLLFHANSRLGRHGDPYGGTFPFKDKFELLPVVKCKMAGETIPLYKPDLKKLEQQDPPFSAILEKRCTIREYSKQPIDIKQLGEFLYRTARIKKMVEESGVNWRPSPGGGALHELEIYPVVNQCQGLDLGLYHYNPLEHHLTHLTNAYLPLVQTLIELSRITGKLEQQQPHVLLVFTARFQRVQIKYQSVAYALILKNVGCLYQTMYLTATAMGLAPCALGGGDSDLFARAAGLDYYQETSVGEFLLGSGPEIS